MWAAGQLKQQAEADLRPTFASGLYFQNKPSTRGLMAIIARNMSYHNIYFVSHSIIIIDYDNRLPVVLIGSFRNHGNRWLCDCARFKLLSRNKNPTQPPFRHGDHDRHDETEAGLSNPALRTLLS